MDEVYDQQITQFLQKIDENFVLANKAAALLLRRVKVFEQRTGEIAESLDTWCSFFNYFHPKDNIDEDVCNKDRRDSYCSFQSGTRSHMSTPSMPRFSKSFHKTPMARTMDLSYPSSANSAVSGESFASASTNLSRDLKNITPPVTTPFYKPSKTPGMDHFDFDNESPMLTPEQRTTFLNGTDVKEAVSAISRRSKAALESPSTPATPDDGDFGPLSSKKSQLLLLGTPAKYTPELILSSGTRAAIERHARKSMIPENKSESPTSSNERTEKDQDKENISFNTVSPGFDTPKTAAIHPPVPTPISRKLANKLSSKKEREDRAPSPILNAESEELVFELAKELEAVNLNKKQPPKFSLSQFPKLFQFGEGAAQLTLVYSKFHSENLDAKAFSLSQLAESLPQYEKARIGLLLEMLVSRRFLRPFTNDGELFWTTV